MTESAIPITIGRELFGSFVSLHYLNYVDSGEQKEKRRLPAREKCRVRKIKSFGYIHMTNFKEKISFYLSGFLYVVFNLRMASTPAETLKATLWQILQTAPFIIGITWIIVAFLQYMANGKKMPWERRIRIFFALGIMAGLFYGIYEYAGVAPAE